MGHFLIPATPAEAQKRIAYYRWVIDCTTSIDRRLRAQRAIDKLTPYAEPADAADLARKRSERC